ncbi:transcriptional regulator [Streptomyces sp. NPDC001941]|uniref:transcriptional regulator n=1 Tax=Streptomyces sp. NPDC001941 TaxID=3154659 RepID=UPI00332F9F21
MAHRHHLTPATLHALEATFDDLATRYPVDPPQALLVRVRSQAGHVHRLLGARMTLAEHRRLLVVGGWLQLLGATLHVDLGQEHAAVARLRAAEALGREVGHPEITAWCHETGAWQLLVRGEYERARELSRTARAFAPVGSSVAIQAAAQEGRASARLRDAAATYAAIQRVHRLAGALEPRKGLEHHYQYDPGKSLSYTATTLAWLGDPAAESYAREVIALLGPGDDVRRWPRRVATAHLDLALTLLGGDRLDEACAAAQQAVLSGRIVPSNHWRALEVVRAVEARRLPEAPGLREAYQALHPAAGLR